MEAAAQLLCIRSLYIRWQLVCEWADRIIVLYQGEVIADGSRDEIFGNQEILDRCV